MMDMTMIFLPPIFCIANMLRGQAIWPHWFYCVFMGIMLVSTLPVIQAAEWGYIVGLSLY